MARVRFSLPQKLLLIFYAILLLSIQFFCLWTYRNAQKERQIASATSYAHAVATSINLSIRECVNISANVKGLWGRYQNTFIQDFPKIIPDMLIRNNVINTVYIAPSGVIAAAYPDSQKNAIGFNLLSFSAINHKTRQAIETRQPTVSGPHNLLRGGVGFIIRNPYFEKGKFLGFSIVGLDWDAFVQEVLSRPGIQDSSYHFGVWETEEEGIITDEYGFVFKNCKGDVSRLVDVVVPIPGDTWHLCVEPVEGWKEFSNMWVEIALTTIVVLVIFAGIFFRQYATSKNLYIAEHDELTNLLSRSTFLKRMDHLLKNNPDERVIVVAADIVNFKLANSMYGTEACDKVLKYLAECFKELSPYKLCTRFGSDHFIFLLKKEEGVDYTEFLEKYSQQILPGAPIENLSVKYGYYGQLDSHTSTSLLSDKALLAAKSILHNYDKVVANYEGPLSTQNVKAQMLESTFLSALQNGDFKVWFQPKFDAKTEELVGAEALVRWIRKDGTVVSPMEFIHVFEEDGLIYRLDQYVFEQVCKLLKQWQKEFGKQIPISINISRVTLQHKNVIKEYEDILKREGLTPENLPLEITESSTAEDSHIQQVTNDLKITGFKIHMDDFGTGLSSLESLNLLPFDVIKLDKSLIDYIGTPVGEELLRHIIEIAQFMKLKIIAEGVETKEQLEFLRKLNCDHIQGYYYAAPMPYEKFVEFCKK